MDGWVSVAAGEFLEDLGMGMGVEEEVFITPIFNRHQLLTGYVGMPRGVALDGAGHAVDRGGVDGDGV